MKKADFLSIFCVLAVIAFFAFVPAAMATFNSLTANHPYVMSFIKFAILATFGEAIGLRIVTGSYNKPGFGLLPKAIVWGFLGIGIAAAFVVFGNGVPTMLATFGLTPSDSTAYSIMKAIGISACLNIIFAPVFMTFHKITDAHISENGGTLGSLLKPIDMARHFKNLNWDVMWNFVFKKTLPFFWIPAHTLTFLMNPQLRVLFAAALGIVLGIILAFANLKKQK